MADAARPVPGDMVPGDMVPGDMVPGDVAPARSATTGLAEGDAVVIGWVNGVPVPSTALGPYITRLAAGPAGIRLGVALGPDAHAGPDGAGPDGAGPDDLKAAALRTWGAKALLVDSLLRAEAARLGVEEPMSPSDWLARLEAAGELPDPTPTEAEMRAYYGTNRHRFHVNEARRVRHVLAADREPAQLVREVAVDAGALARLAASDSLDQGSRHRGGDLGWGERGQLAGPLEEAIFGAEPDRVVGPVPSPFGWHVIVVEAVRAARDRSFRECRTEIRDELTEYRRRRSWLDWLDRRVAEGISVPAGAEHPLFRGLPGSSHRH